MGGSLMMTEPAEFSTTERIALEMVSAAAANDGPGIGAAALLLSDGNTIVEDLTDIAVILTKVSATLATIVAELHESKDPAKVTEVIIGAMAARRKESEQ